MQFTFDSIKNYLITTLNQLSNFTQNILYYGLISRIIDIVAFGVEKLAYYAEFLLKESNLKTATLRQSLTSKSYFLSYTPHRMRGASGYCKVTPQLGIYNIFVELDTYTPCQSGDVSKEIYVDGVLMGPLVSYDNTTQIWEITDAEQLGVIADNAVLTILDGTGSGTADGPSYFTYTDSSVVFTKFTKLTNAGGVTNIYTTNEEIYYRDTVVVSTVIFNSAAIDLGGGYVGIPVTNHHMPISQTVSIRNSQNYDGDFVIEAATLADIIVINAIYKEEVFVSSESIYTGHVYLPVREGVPKNFTYTAGGVVNEELPIYSDSVDNDIIEVAIVDDDGIELNEVTITTEPYFVNDTENYYAEVLNSSDYESIIVRFGDNIYTRKLVAGEKVKVSYAETLGELGNVTSSGIITKFKDRILDANGNVNNLSVTNDDEISDGSDVEGIESIRKNSRRLFQAGYRAGSHNDWKAIIESHPQIHKAIVWTSQDLGLETLTVQQNEIAIAAITTDGSNITIAQQQDLWDNYLIDKRSITDIISWKQLSVINLKFVIDAKVINKPFTTIESDLTTTLLNTYDILNRDFGPDYSVHFSNWNKLIDTSVDIIRLRDATTIYNVEKSSRNVGIQISANDLELTTSKPSTITSNTEEQIYLTAGSFELWIQRKIEGTLQTAVKIAQDNGSGGLIETGEYDLPEEQGGTGELYTLNSSAGGTIVYTTNTLSYQISNIFNNPTAYGILNPTSSDDDGYFISFIYKTEDGAGSQTNSVRLAYFYQIVDLDEEDITYSLAYL